MIKHLTTLYATLRYALIPMPKRPKNGNVKRMEKWIEAGDFDTLLQRYEEANLQVQLQMSKAFYFDDLFDALEEGDIDGTQRALDNHETWSALRAHCERNLSNATSQLILGCMHMSLARQYRGSAWAEDVSEQQWQMMSKHADAARQCIHQSIKLNPKHLAAFWAMSDCLLLNNAEKELHWQYYRRAQQLGEPMVQINRAMLYALTQKWGGSHEAMFDFARRWVAHVGAGDANLALIADAHIECWLVAESDRDRYFLRPEVKTELEQAYQRFKQGWQADDVGKGSADSFLFCFYLMGDKERCCELFDFMGECFNTESYPWFYRGFAENDYGTLRRWHKKYLKDN